MKKKEKKQINNIKKWTSYKYWENHKKFFEENQGDTKKLLIYMFNVLENRRAFNYYWISDIHKIALGELLGETID